MNWHRLALVGWMILATSALIVGIAAGYWAWPVVLFIAAAIVTAWLWGEEEAV